jgi:hypothetical protein
MVVPMLRPSSDTGRVALAGLALAGAAAAIIGLRIPKPYISIWLVALSLSVLIAVRARTAWAERLGLIGSGLAGSLLLCEVVVIAGWALAPGKVELGGSANDPSFWITGGSLGYGPRPGGQYTASKWVDGRSAYDVTYTISDEGIRATRGSSSGDTWLFLGGSQTFGWGVEDDETLPAAFSKELGFSANVLNLGFNGYGAHQMLRSFETGRIDSLTNGSVKQVIYQGVWSHAWRTAGRVPWDLNGAFYTLNGETVSYAGPSRGSLEAFLVGTLMRSDFLRLVLDVTFFWKRIDDLDVERYVRVLERSAKLAREAFGSGFLVVYWDEDTEVSNRIVERLRETALPVLFVSEIIPREDWPILTLRGDPHPSPEAYRRVAAGLAELLATKD